MVMESPSPQSVGREFVRQYYTLMNEAPNYLHRFYSTESSFIHSDVDKPGQEAVPVYGQKDINKKIAELNFSDCHTKIRQVDSQSTVGNGVVVQVTGELSNRGGAMRRFMQTFVLAHQTPKQYYVHNDIFRYQDEVFHDSYESEEESEHHHAPAAEAPIENGTAREAIGNVAIVTPEQNMPGINTHSSTPERSATPTQPEPAELTPQSTPSPVKKIPEPIQPEPAKPTVQPKQEPVPTEPEVAVSSEGDEPAAGEQEPPKAFSWANVVNKSAGGSSAAVAVVSPMNSSAGTNKQTALPLSVITSQQKEEESMAPTAPVQDDQLANQRNARPNVDQMAGSRPPRHELPPGGERVDRRTNERYPDEQQVFVGNLPQDIAELELKRFFVNYGKVLDIRINRGGGASGKVPFGFVVFDSDEPVKHLLQLKRVEMDGHRLNVEEKKARNDRSGSNSRAPRGPRQPQRAGSRPKDREGSGSRLENRPNRKFQRP